MKVSELIEALQKIDQDNEVHISVHDYFSRYGFEATINIDTTGYVWSGVSSHDKHTTLDVHLIGTNYPGEGEKEPKITFRKI